MSYSSPRKRRNTDELNRDSSRSKQKTMSGDNENQVGDVSRVSKLELEFFDDESQA